MPARCGRRSSITDTPLGDFWITRACLGQHDLRAVKISQRVSLLVPPHHGELLMSRYKQIPAWPCREITDDARFDIDGASGDARI